jgi:FAD/FMN-containing dehydrogenase
MKPRRLVPTQRWLDSANRSFFALVAIALVPYALLGLFGCGLLTLAGYRLAAQGLAGLNRDGQDLRPGMAFFTVVTAGTVAAAVSVRRQVRATRALASHLRKRAMPMPHTVTAAAGAVALAFVLWGGAVARVDADATAFGQRYGRFLYNAVATWEDPTADATQVPWARAFHDAMQPSATGGVYVNFLSEEGHERVRAAYGEDKFARLTTIKAAYDPTNLFALNQNIPPATPERYTAP